MIVYGILGYLHGKLGNSTKMPVRLVALSAKLMEGDGIPPVTKSVTLLGNSRMAQAGVQYPPNLGLGIGSRLVTQGAANSLPEDVRVQNRAVGGEGIGVANLISELGLSDNTCPAASPLHNDYKFGGEKITFVLLSGANDTSARKWPEITGPASTAAHVLDGYNGNNGLGHVGSIMATVPANSRTATMSEASGRGGDDRLDGCRR
ncbi:hypothetical protein D2T29_04870 [Sinirhodobacter populi]|uniref:Uncharacterized protein n=1 Tax=Paenirhodobacter populi TaxID=2306993 RepID=A0A443KN99_9RHOB|nr:hypothetical protein [Sinirhodobacter populi]RWR34232.1 hypothetical protein D2T29_04870 [Sinirhodobacter populi]